MIAKLPAALRARFDAYAEGVNAWIAKIAADPSLQPLEFAALQLTPAPWRPIDSASIGVQLARTIPSSDGTELANWEALRKLGPKRFAKLLPLRRKDQVATIPAADGRFPSTPGRTRKDERLGYKRSRNVPARPESAEGRGDGLHCAVPRRLERLGGPRQRQPLVAVPRPAAGLRDPRAARRARGAPARARRRAASRPRACRSSASAATTTSRGR